MAIEREVIVEDITLDLEISTVLDSPPFSRWYPDRPPRDDVVRLLERIIENVKRDATPRGIYRILPSDDTCLAERSPPPALSDADYLGIGVRTLGDGGSDPGTPSAAVFRNAVENVALGQVKLPERIAAIADAHGFETTRAIPPGSGSVDWGVENQAFVFEHVAADRIDVSLTPSHAIEPSKSSTFVIGFGKDVEASEELFSCRGCPLVDCPYRV